MSTEIMEQHLAFETHAANKDFKNSTLLLPTLSTKKTEGVKDIDNKYFSYSA